MIKILYNFLNDIVINKTLYKKIRKLTLRKDELDKESDISQLQIFFKNIEKKQDNHYSDIVSFLSYRKNKLVGLCIVYVYTSNTLKYNVLNIYVSKKHRNKGIATELINKVIDFYKDRNCYELCVYPWDDKSFYFFGKFLDQLKIVKC